MEHVSLIIIAMDEELNALLDALDFYEIIDDDICKRYLYKKNNINYLITLGKIGKVSTAFLIGKISSYYNIDRIINIGTSGALQCSLNIGDVVIASNIIYSDVDVTGFNYKLGQVPSMPYMYTPDEEYISSKVDNLNNLSFSIHRGLISSSDSFVTKNNYDKLPEFIKENALCAEMESGSVAQCATIINVPFIIIRSISDYVLSNNNSKQMDINMDQVCKNCAEVLIRML